MSFSSWTCDQLQYAQWAAHQGTDPNWPGYQAAWASKNCVLNTNTSTRPVMPIGYVDPSGNNNNGVAPPPVYDWSTMSCADLQNALADVVRGNTNNLTPDEVAAAQAAWTSKGCTYSGGSNTYTPPPGQYVPPTPAQTGECNYLFYLLNQAKINGDCAGWDAAYSAINTGFNNQACAPPPGTPSDWTVRPTCKSGVFNAPNTRGDPLLLPDGTPNPMTNCAGAKDYLTALTSKQATYPSNANLLALVQYRQLMNAVGCDVSNVNMPTVQNCATLVPMLQTAHDTDNYLLWQSTMDAINAFQKKSGNLKCAIPTALKTPPGDANANNGGGGGNQPPSNECDPNSVALIDWFLKFPLTGLATHPLIGSAFVLVGVLGSAAVGYLLIPELMGEKLVKIPVLLVGAYGGLFANGVLANFSLFGNIEKYGLVAGGLLTLFKAGTGFYGSLQHAEENFLMNTLGAKAGEIVYKIAQGPYGFVSSIVFKDKTWGTAGYTNVKCENNCGDPSLSSDKRKLCKMLSRFDIRWHF